MANIQPHQLSANTGPGAPVRVGLVAGASGIVGENLCKHLLTRGWKVYGTSRKPKNKLPPDVHLINCDLEDKQSLTDALKAQDISSVSHLFFCAWAPGPEPLKSNKREDIYEYEQKTTEKNSKMFQNFLDVCCDILGSGLKHVHLLTGTKYYGVHLGPKYGYKIPSTEDHPRVEFPLFYYAMEDYLKEKQFSSKASWTWSVVRPDAIIGSGMNNFMNLGVSVAIYAAIQKEKGLPLTFPGTEKAYNSLKTFSDVNVVNRAQIWMSDDSITENKNQAYNINNGHPITWRDLWEEIATNFNMKTEPPGKEPVNLANFFQENETLWKNLCKQGLVKECDLKSLVTPDFMEFYTTKMEWDNVTSMEKAHKMGFKDGVSESNCWKSFFQVLREKTIIP